MPDLLQNTVKNAMKKRADCAHQSCAIALNHLKMLIFGVGRLLLPDFFPG